MPHRQGPVPGSMRIPWRAIPAALLVPAMTGCAAQGSTRYPSLLPRPIEARDDAEPVTPAVAAAQPDPATDARLAEVRKTLNDANAAFVRAVAAAEALATAARGDAVGSERWIAAQTALAELDGHRATTSAALNELDEMAIGRAADGKPDYPALTTLRTTAQTALDAETARIAAIQARLPAA